jgi:hypothetical protein
MIPAGKIWGRQDDPSFRVEGAADARSDGDDLRMAGDEPRGMSAKIVDHWSRAATGKRWPLRSRHNLAVAATDYSGAFAPADVQTEK